MQILYWLSAPFRWFRRKEEKPWTHSYGAIEYSLAYEKTTQNEMKKEEYLAQVAIFKYVRDMAVLDKRYEMVVSTLNGAWLKGGASEWNKLKAAGASKGFPDILCLLPSEYFHGLIVELKMPGNSPTKEQEEWLDRLSDWGYQAVVCYGAKETVAVIDAYIKFVPKQSPLSSNQRSFNN